MTMPAVAPVHEEVHQRARQEQEVRENPEHMRGMLRDEEESGDPQDQTPTSNADANDPKNAQPR